MTTLSPDDLRAIRARAAAATEGPWIAYADSCAECARQKTSEWNVNGLESGYHGQIDKEADALFIAHSRSDIPALLAHIATLEQQLAEARADREVNQKMPTNGELSRFQGKYKIDPVSGCWLWIASRTPRGYGQFFGDQRAPQKAIRWQAHRFSYFAHKGSIPDGLLVFHRCDVRNCVNPSHLFLGTDEDNKADMKSKGRQAFLRGARNGNAKLTKEAVLIIRQSSLSDAVLGGKFNVGKTAIRKARKFLTWKDLGATESQAEKGGAK